MTNCLIDPAARHSRESGNPATLIFQRNESERYWIPAFAGMTAEEKSRTIK
jgi:hypothetical protein